MNNRYGIKYDFNENNGSFGMVIDEILDEHSSNPVANWVLKEAIDSGGGGGSGVWGHITGTITDQTDLVNYVASHGAGTWGSITGTLTDQTDLINYISNALDNYYTKSVVYTKTEVDTLLDGKADVSDIPTVNDATLTIQKNGTTIDTFTANSASNKTVNVTVPVDAEDVGALPDTTKYGSRISMTIDNTTFVVTTTLKDQDGNTLGTAQTIDLPLESVVVNGRYDNTTKKVILTLQNGSTIEFSVADLVAGLQSEITSTNKLDADLVDDSTSTNKFVSGTVGTDTVPVYLDNGTITACDADFDDVAFIGSTAGTPVDLVDIVYPIGSIYMSVNNVSPATIIGGTWVQIKDTFLLAAGDSYTAGDTGGEAETTLTSANLPTHTHTYDKANTPTGAASGDTGSTTLTTSQIPSHTHTITSNHTAASETGGDAGYPVEDSYDSSKTQLRSVSSTGGGQGHTHTLNSHTHTISSTSTDSGNGGFANTAHNNMPPYLTVYMWQRTA